MPLWLVMGGISSGKSAWAEKFIIGNLKHHQVEYIATLDESLTSADDWVLRQKLAEHRMRRPSGWTLWKDADNPFGRILKLPPTAVILWDGVGPYIARYLTGLGKNDESHELQNSHSREEEQMDLDREMKNHWDEMLSRISQRTADTLIVSEEIGLGLIPTNRDTNEFIRSLGNFNQIAAHYAAAVIFVVAGLPLWIKGVPQ